MKIRIWAKGCGLKPYKYSGVTLDEGPIKGGLRVSPIPVPSSAPKEPLAMFAPGFWELVEILDHETGEDNGETCTFKEFEEKALGDTDE